MKIVNQTSSMSEFKHLTSELIKPALAISTATHNLELEEEANIYYPQVAKVLL